jgi:hypothetical protein
MHFFHDAQSVTRILVEDFEADDPHGYVIDDAEHDSMRFGLNYRF